MSSTMVSNCMEFREKFPSAGLNRSYLELMAQQTSTFDKPDLPAPVGFTPANPVGRPPISRRHSSTAFGATATKASLGPFADNTGLFGNMLNGALETVAEERFRNRAFSEGSSVLSSDSTHDQQQQQVQSATSRYKTELCRPFEENGKCKYGDKCQFAHGKHELRHMVRHPKYKTELCRTYHTSGLCPYGPRCHFIHNQDEPTVGMQRQVSQGHTMPVPISTQRQASRPSNLLLSQQRGLNRLGSLSYSPPNITSPLDTQSPFFAGVTEPALLSPISPMGNGAGQKFFGYGQVPLDLPRANAFGPETRQATPPLTQFDVFTQGQQLLDLPSNDDAVFDGPPTPPDSDRESATGSPPGILSASQCPQRLPIFRCLSQSE